MNADVEPNYSVKSSLNKHIPLDTIGITASFLNKKDRITLEQTQWNYSFPPIEFTYFWKADSSHPGEDAEYYELPKDISIKMSDETKETITECIKNYIFNILSREKNKKSKISILPTDVETIEVVIDLSHTINRDGTRAEQQARAPDYDNYPILINSEFNKHNYSVYISELDVVMKDKTKKFFDTGYFNCKDLGLKMYGHIKYKSSYGGNKYRKNNKNRRQNIY